MRNHWRLLALMLPFALVPLAWGQESDFISLFNGADLTGWRYGKEILHRQTQTADGRFSVSGGVIAMAAKDSKGNKGVKDIFTVREFNKDFIVKLEFKASNEAHAAVLIRGTAIPIGDFTRRNEQRQLKSFHTDGWNELEVKVVMTAHAEGRRLPDADNLEISYQGGKATVKVNGRTVDPNRTVIAIHGFPKVNGTALQPNWAFGVATKGQIGLRTGSQKMEFKNIRFKELQ